MHYKTCEVCGLRSGRMMNKKRTFMAKFPLDEERCKKWVKITGKEDLAYVPIEKLHELKFVCGKHFRPKDFKKKNTQLKKNAVPSVLITNKPLPDEILVGFPLHISKDSEPIALNKPSKSQCLDVDAKLALTDYTVFTEHDYCLPYNKSRNFSSSITETNNSTKRSCSSICTMAPVKCYYNGCFNTSATKSLFSFPIKDEPRLELWLKHSGNAQLASLTHQELRHRYICQDHFEADVILKNAMRSRLVPTAVPHMFKSVTSQYTDSAASKPENELQDPLRDDEDSNESNHQTLLDKETADKGRGRVRVVCICNGCSNVISGFRYICVQCTDVDLCGACEASGLHELHYLLRVPRQRPEKEISSILGKIREELMKYENIVESIEIDMEDGPDPLGVVQRNYTDARCSTEVSSDHEMNTHNKRSRMEMEEFLNKDRNASSHITTESVSAVPNNEKEFDSSPNIKVEADVSEEERCEVFVHKDPVSSELKTMSTHLSDPNIIQRPTIEKNQLQTNGLVPTLVVSNFIVPTTYVVVTGATPMASIGMLGYPTMVPQTLPGVPPDVLGMQRDRPGVKPGRYFVKVTGTDTNERNGDQLQENQ